MCYIFAILLDREFAMNKTISMSIRVSEDDLEKLKLAAQLEEYSSYSEFVRRTSLQKANEIIKKAIQERINEGKNS